MLVCNGILQNQCKWQMKKVNVVFTTTASINLFFCLFNSFLEFMATLKTFIRASIFKSQHQIQGLIEQLIGIKPYLQWQSLPSLPPRMADVNVLCITPIRKPAYGLGLDLCFRSLQKQTNREPMTEKADAGPNCGFNVHFLCISKLHSGLLQQNFSGENLPTARWHGRTTLMLVYAQWKCTVCLYRKACCHNIFKWAYYCICHCF